MRKIVPVAVVFGAVWLWQHLRGPGTQPEASVAQPTSLFASGTDGQTTAFSCDGRQYCSQMISCAEATYFLQRCPDVKMDGNHDGVPCERQWCGTR